MTTHAKALSTIATLFFAAQTLFAAGFHGNFQSPPNDSKPLTWWHWIDGNVTKSGITKDLEAMKRAGLGGCYLFSIGGYFPKGPALFGDPGWFDLLSHSVNEADRLGLIFGVHNCDGWSESGGPWITPETSMKELTYSAVEVQGSRVLDSTLPIPDHKENFYRDIAVLAFPVPAGHRVNGPETRVTGSPDSASLKSLCDGQLSPRVAFAASTSGHHVELTLPEPRIVRSMILRNMNGTTSDEDIPVSIEISTDGASWQPAGSCSLAWDTADGAKPITVAFDSLRLRSLRLLFTNRVDLEIGEIELSDTARLQFTEAKAGRLRCRGHGGETRNFSLYPGPNRQRQFPADRFIAPASVSNLTARLTADGRLNWTVPEGKWRILRIGYTTNGRKNKPATPAGTGLECDKLDPGVVRFHLDQYVGRLTEVFGPRTGKVFKAVETDSWECDIQNWTAGFEKRFQTKTGFDVIPWMPLLLEGWIIESADASERVLWDWRRFLADQFAENYFAQVSAYLKARNLTYVCEGSGRQMYNYDAVGYQRDGDVPMGEFWLNTGPGQGVRVDNKVASSVAHITGKRVVASESYTASAPFARWQNHPYTLKPLGDRAFCAGVNQFVFHTFAHQPYEVAGPGFTMAVWGLNCNRANTWWEPAKAWMAYLARCNYVLRQGRFAADVLSFVGEDVPNRIGWRDELSPELPDGYDFDGCDAKALMDASVRDGKIVLPSGTEYRVLLLPNKTTMRPPVLRKISTLVNEGAIVFGPRPLQSPSMSDRNGADTQVRQLAAEVWGACDGLKIKEHQYGRGRVFWGLTFPEVFKQIGLVEDFDFQAASADAEVLYIHRTMDNAEVYFVANQKPRIEKITARFRVQNRLPESWDPVTGTTRRLGLFRSTETGSEVPLVLDPAGSLFIVFREKTPAAYVVSASPGDLEVHVSDAGSIEARAWNSGSVSLKLVDGSAKSVPSVTVPAPLDLTGAWNVSFPPGLGAPSSAVFEKLISWPDHSEQGIRYFSGTAVYSTDFDLTEQFLSAGRELWLDLGQVEVIAQLRVNDQDLGTLWKPPFRMDATKALKPGKNHLEIRVTNLWPNRMIGDEQLPDAMPWKKVGARTLPARWPDWVLNGKPRPDGRVTFCTRKVYKKDDPLLPSGLIGPVRILASQHIAF